MLCQPSCQSSLTLLMTPVGEGKCLAETLAQTLSTDPIWEWRLLCRAAKAMFLPTETFPLLTAAPLLKKKRLLSSTQFTWRCEILRHFIHMHLLFFNKHLACVIVNKQRLLCLNWFEFLWEKEQRQINLPKMCTPACIFPTYNCR